MSYFRPRQPLNVSPSLVWLLGAFDVFLIAYLILEFWRMA